MKKIMITALLLAGLTSMGYAAPSTMGSTGMIDTPTADTLREGQLSLGYYDLDEGQNISFGMNIAKNLELGIAATNAHADSRQTYVNLKYALKQEGVLLPGIAIGMEDIADRSERSAYAVVSKALPLGFRVHAGFGNGRYDGAFYAVEKSIVPMAIGGVFPDTSLIIEHDGHAMNYGLRMSVVAGLKVNAGWRDKEPYVGVTYNLY